MTEEAATKKWRTSNNKTQYSIPGFIRNMQERMAERRALKLSDRVFRIGTYILLFDLAFVFLFPFFYMIVTSLKTNADLYNFTVNWVPRTVKIQNYVIAFRALDYIKYLKNSLILTLLGTAGHILACSFIGYGFARYDFPGKTLLFSIVILSLIVPVQTIIIPQYMIFCNLKWLNTYLPMIVPTFFGYGLKGGLFIFIFRQFYLGLPKALEDAAKIDGCGFFRTYWNIVLPVAQSALLVTLVLSLVWHWNDFYEPSIYISKMMKTPLPSRLNELVNLVNTPPSEEIFDSLIELEAMEEEMAINNAVLMAGTFLVVIPVMTAFAFLQSKFMQGIERTGLVE
ncbi:MAG TPA: carbohydrate ABC transporter permease [Clostridiales bacterium]|nr:carbohydrate ABC transporter permease [Clostridiales bacterium]